ncbi:mCG1042643, partial [Mus musculus]
KTHNVRTPPRSDSGEATPQNHQRENGLVANCKRIFIQERSRAHGHTPRRGRGLWRPE